MEILLIILKIVAATCGIAVALAGLFLTAVGLLTVFHWVKSPRHPVDKSNVINRIRLWWFALTRPELFVDLFPWLQYDEYKNITGRR